MADNLLGLLGLALRGGNLAVGDEPGAEACRTGRAALLLTAADGAGNTLEKAARLAERAEIPHIPVPRSKAELGAALGLSACAVLAVTEAGLAAALVRRLAEEDESLAPLAERLSEKAGRKGRPGRKRAETRRGGPAAARNI